MGTATKSQLARGARAQRCRPMLPTMTTPAVDPVVRDLSRALLPQVDAFAERMADLIRSQEPLYAEGLAVSPGELFMSCRENLLYVFGRLAGEPNIGTEAPRATGSRRAEA